MDQISNEWIGQKCGHLQSDWQHTVDLGRALHESVRFVIMIQKTNTVTHLHCFSKTTDVDDVDAAEVRESLFHVPAVCSKILGHHARINNVGKYQSCMYSKWPTPCKQTTVHVREKLPFAAQTRERAKKHTTAKPQPAMQNRRSVRTQSEGQALFTNTIGNAWWYGCARV